MYLTNNFIGACFYTYTCVVFREHVKCGSLHCKLADGVDKQVNFLADWTKATDLEDSSENKECSYSSYLTFYNGPERQDPGLVPDGANCGDNKV